MFALYGRDISVAQFIKFSSEIPLAMPCAIRLLYILLFEYKSMRSLNKEEAESLSVILSKSMSIYLNLEEENSKDELFIYMIFKIADLIYYPDIEIVSMMGNRVCDHPLLKLFKLDRDCQLFVNEPNFWRNYFRLNIKFYEQYPSYFMKGQDDCKKQIVLKKEKSNKIFKKGNLFGGFFNQISIRRIPKNINASTLNDVIRYLIYLNIKLPYINKICENLTVKLKLDRRMAYQVFKETEDEFSIREYIPKIVGSYTELWTNEAVPIHKVFSQCFKFLDSKSWINLLLLNKNLYKKVEPLILLHVLKNVDLTLEDRIKIWPRLMDDVSYYKLNRNQKKLL